MTNSRKPEEDDVSRLIRSFAESVLPSPPNTLLFDLDSGLPWTEPEGPDVSTQDAARKFWSLAPYVTLLEACALVLFDDANANPHTHGGFVPLKRALLGAVQQQEISSYVDNDQTWLEASSLRSWLTTQGLEFTQNALFGKSVPNYLDPTHERHAPQLVAAIRVWIALDRCSPSKSVQTHVTEYLSRHADELGLQSLRKRDGALPKKVIERIFEVINWNRDGGAPRTTTKP